MLPGFTLTWNRQAITFSAKILTSEIRGQKGMQEREDMGREIWGRLLKVVGL